MKVKLWRAIGLASLFLLSPGLASGQNLQEGRKLYVSYCATCHGEQGRGDGPAGRALPVKPADHTSGAVMNQMTDKYLMDIIAKGGASVGKSAIMPAWANQFDQKQMEDLVAYIRSIAKPPKGDAK